MDQDSLLLQFPPASVSSNRKHQLRLAAGALDLQPRPDSLVAGLSTFERQENLAPSSASLASSLSFSAMRLTGWARRCGGPPDRAVADHSALLSKLLSMTLVRRAGEMAESQIPCSGGGTGGGIRTHMPCGREV